MGKDTDEIVSFPVLSLEAVEEIAITAEAELDEWGEVLQGLGLPNYYIVGMLMNQVQYLLIQDD